MRWRCGATVAWAALALGGSACDGVVVTPDPATCAPAPEEAAERCELSAVIGQFEASVLPLTARCASCHDATAPPALLKAPGPPWLYPGDPAATVRAILRLGLVSARIPLASLFLLKPSGAVEHGGGQVLRSDCDLAPWVAFVLAAAPCARP